MANGHGGARANAGRPRKALADAVIDGARASRLKAVNFDSIAEELDEDGLPTVPEVMEYMQDVQKDGNKLLAEEFFQKTWKWLVERKSEKLFDISYLQRFSMQQARYVQLEQLISKHGFLAIGVSGVRSNPLEEMLITRLKIVNSMQAYIEGVVRENCTEAFTGISGGNDPMEALLNGKR